MKVGFEIHIQVNSARKLFCNCNPKNEDISHLEFRRRLRVSSSELGEIDPAAAFEIKKGLDIIYVSGDKTSCLVEADEEPPHEPDPYSVEAAIKVSNMLNAFVVDEIHFMRKIVVDGSNTSGFQRTAIVGLNGNFDFRGKNVRIQTVCLEEDAARLQEKGEGHSKYELKRLGIPLLEITTEPLEISSEEARALAESLGRTLKLTGLFARGLGTIRQDVNVSLEGGGIVEVKGVQKLEQVSKVIDFEEKRHKMLFEIAAKLKERGVNEDSFEIDPIDVSEIFKSYANPTVKKFFKDSAMALKAPGFKGLLSYETVPDSRIGLDLADICRLFGFKGIIHSDEILKYGFGNDILNQIEDRLKVTDNDAYVLVFGDKEKAALCLQMVKERLKMAIKGPVAETRYATDKGTTRYLRPRPGASRMYPETDIPTIKITKEMKDKFKIEVKSWEKAVEDFSFRYSINKEMAEQILDSDFIDFFENAAESFPNVPPTLIASLIVQVFIPYQNVGKNIEYDEFIKLIELFSKGSIAKEAVIDLARYMLEKGLSLDNALKEMNIEKLSVDDLRKIIQEKISEVLQENIEPTKLYGTLMGRVMSVVRGKIEGKIVDEEVRKALESLKKD
ncbi:MAG: Glu-tRNA(Gln) amidotransferase subunit GatE [Conexivisphaerales archaeon]|nr:Glu-tRNA(Gln) amidotransferase subunit GatE [Conexivisphaerales archaeon]